MFTIKRVVFLLFFYGVAYTNAYHPCPDLDVDCVRQFFADHSNCKKACGPKEDKFNTELILIPLPNGNTSLIWKDSDVIGLSKGEVQKLYLNKNKTKLIFEVLFREVKTYSPSLTIKFYQRGKEPCSKTDYGSITYRMVTTTLIVPYDCEKGINWDDKQQFTYFIDAAPTFVFGTKTYNNTETISFPEKPCIEYHLGVSLQEASMVKGMYYFLLYFDNNICDFGDLPYCKKNKVISKGCECN